MDALSDQLLLVVELHGFAEFRKVFLPERWIRSDERRQSGGVRLSSEHNAVRRSLLFALIFCITVYYYILLIRDHRRFAMSFLFCCAAYVLDGPWDMQHCWVYD